ncbi:hypothetical protein LPN03_04620 [Arthrobacter sp. A2-55]|nr:MULTISPECIES: hypothetical protein [Arthrobacter]MCU6479640.1 hypothetical protein [Arthrobacter sp. A2-55]
MIPAKVFWASRLVRFDIGSRRLAVLASHTVIRARGRTENPACRAVPTTTRVSRTAVASKDRKTVHTTATIATTRHTKNADRAPPKLKTAATHRKIPASPASAVTTVIDATNDRIGATRTSNATTPTHGRRRATTVNPATANKIAPKPAKRIAQAYSRPAAGPRFVRCIVQRCSTVKSWSMRAGLGGRQ